MGRNKKKKALISGYIGFQNFGDDALLTVLTEHLKEKDCDISAFSSNPADTEKNFNIKAYNYKNLFLILREILKTDILISGGGNLIQNETSTLSLLYYCFIIIFAKLCFKKVIIFSQGIGPVRGNFSTFISKLALKCADMITVRDIYSQRILSKWGINSKFTYDACWNFDGPKYQPQNIVGIQIRNYAYLHKDFFKIIAKYVDMFFSDYEIKIFSFQNKNDAQLCYKMERALKQRNMDLKTKVVLYKSPNQIAEEFSKLKYLIAMRLHANILGLKLGVKVVPASYSVKVRNLAYEFDLKYFEASEEALLHPILTDLTMTEQENPKIKNARSRKFEWSFIDTVIDK